MQHKFYLMQQHLLNLYLLSFVWGSSCSPLFCIYWVLFNAVENFQCSRNLFLQQKFCIAEICIAEIFNAAEIYIAEKFVCWMCCRFCIAAEICSWMYFWMLYFLYCSRNLQQILYFLYAECMLKFFCRRNLYCRFCIAADFVLNVCRKICIFCVFD